MEAIAALAARELSVPRSNLEVVLRVPVDHQTNRLWDVWCAETHFIAKEFIDRDPDEGAEREFQSLQLLLPLGLAPRPISRVSAAAEHGPVVLYEFLEGLRWPRRPPSPEQLRQLAEAYIQINSLPTDGGWLAANMDIPLSYREAAFRRTFEDYALWAKSAYPPARLAAELCIKAIDRLRPNVAALAAATPALLFCQTDARFANFIERPDGGVAFVDWEDAGLRDPARQIADLLMHANQEDLLSLEEWRPFTDRYYGALKGTDPDLEQRVHTCLPLFCIFWLSVIIQRNVQGLRHSGTADEPVNELPVNARLRRYLARAFAWPDPDFSKRLEQLSELEFFPSGA